MELRHLVLFVMLGTAAPLGGCDAGPDYRAYPGLLDLEEISIPYLRTTAPLPGRYNVSGIVVEVTTCDCPPEALCVMCEYPDGVVVSETGGPLPAEGYVAADTTFLLVAAEDPEQFRIGRRYALSVEVEDVWSQRPVYLALLLGYDVRRGSRTR